MTNISDITTAELQAELTRRQSQDTAEKKKDYRKSALMASCLYAVDEYLENISPDLTEDNKQEFIDEFTETMVAYFIECLDGYLRGALVVGHHLTREDQKAIESATRRKIFKT